MKPWIGARFALQRVLAARSAPRVGYIGGAPINLGDACMRAVASALLPDATILPYVYAGIERRLERVRLSGPRYFSAVILGGGTLISPYGHQVVQRAADQGVPLFAAGTGAGPGGFSHSPEQPLADWAPLLNGFVRVGVRGPRSLQRLHALGVERCEVVGDLALGLTRGKSVPAAAAPRRFGINVLWPHSHATFEMKTLDAVGAAVRRLVEGGWEPIPFAMAPGDDAALRRVLDRAACEADIAHPAAADALLDHLAPCTVVVSMRLHGSVLAACAGVPPLVIGYMDKCRDFAESMQLEHLHVSTDGLSAQAIVDRVQDIAQQGAHLRQDVLDQARAWQTRLAAFFDGIRSDLGMHG